MPLYAPVSATTVYNPSVLATLNEYANTELIAQGYTENLWYGFLFGSDRRPGLGDRPKYAVPDFRRPERKTMEGTQAEWIVNFETAGNMRAFYDLTEFTDQINQGGTKLFTQWAHYRTRVAMSRTQARENSGSGKQFDILKGMLDQDDRYALTKLETDLLSTNTDISHSAAQDEVVGLRHWNSTAPTTGTRAGINTAVFTPFRNNIATCTSFAATGIDDMEAMSYTTGAMNGHRSVDCIWMNQTQHGYFVKQAQAIHRIVGGLGSGDPSTNKTLMFKGIPLIWHSLWPANRQDWINTKELKALVLKGDDWDVESPGKPSNVALAYDQVRFFTCATIHVRPETNGVLTVSGA